MMFIPLPWPRLIDVYILLNKPHQVVHLTQHVITREEVHPGQGLVVRVLLLVYLVELHVELHMQVLGLTASCQVKPHSWIVPFTIYMLDQ